MQLVQTTPSQIRLVGFDGDVVSKQLDWLLTYHDKKVDFEYTKFKKNGSFWYSKRYGEEATQERLAELKAARYKSLRFVDSEGEWTYSGLADKLKEAFPSVELVREFTYPSPKLLAYEHMPKYKARKYQVEAVEALLLAKHAGVEIGTGLGKSYIIRMLLAELGLQTIIMAPSLSIAKQLYKDFLYHFGKKNVGFVGDGKKEYGKLLTVGISASLTKLEPGSDGYEKLKTAQVFIADESHQCPAATLASVCFGLAKDAPYRFFFSGTQLRQDGLDLLLDGITNRIVYRLTVEQGVNQGYLAKPLTRMLQIKSKVNFDSYDANEMTRAHLYYNPEVAAKAAAFANQCVAVGRQVVILVEEVEQITYLLPHLAHQFGFAHGGLNKDNIDKVPIQFHESDPEALVDEFNAGKLPILVGTSCISTGTDLQPVGALIYMQGGKSEIQLKQAIGRGTRGGWSEEVFVRHVMEGPLKDQRKLDCYVLDFDIQLPGDVHSKYSSDEGPKTRWSSVHRHSLERVALYKGIYPSFEYIEG